MATFKQNAVRYNYSSFFKNVAKNYTRYFKIVVCYSSELQLLRYYPPLFVFSNVENIFCNVKNDILVSEIYRTLKRITGVLKHDFTLNHVEIAFNLLLRIFSSLQHF